MFNSLKNIINSGSFQLDSMKTRLENLAAHGDITPEQKEELLNDARTKADAANEIDVRKMLLEHANRIRALEAKLGMGDTPETDEDGAEIVPDFVVGKTYYNGDKVTWKGSVYECIAPEGAVCVWSPDDYPTYWQKVE